MIQRVQSFPISDTECIEHLPGDIFIIAKGKLPPPEAWGMYTGGFTRQCDTALKVTMRFGGGKVGLALRPGVPYQIRPTQIYATGTTATEVIGIYTEREAFDAKH